MSGSGTEDGGLGCRGLSRGVGTFRVVGFRVVGFRVEGLGIYGLGF